MSKNVSSPGKPTASAREAWVYIVQCADKTFYTGWCYNVTMRVAAHNRGRGAKYTRGRRPVRLRWCERHPSRTAAMRREAEIKRLDRRAKERLIEAANNGYGASDG